MNRHRYCANDVVYEYIIRSFINYSRYNIYITHELILIYMSDALKTPNQEIRFDQKNCKTLLVLVIFNKVY